MVMDVMVNRGHRAVSVADCVFACQRTLERQAGIRLEWSAALKVRRLIFCALLSAAVAAAACGVTVERVTRGHVRVAAADELKGALPELIARFGESHDVDVAVTYGASRALYDQLLDRAPFDLFLSADLHYPNELVARGLTLPQTEFTYAVGRLEVERERSPGQGGVILGWAADPEAARALRRFLLSADGRAILERAGYALPDRR
jgi:ABC-type molybdate transport system substrate-binding protein